VRLLRFLGLCRRERPLSENLAKRLEEIVEAAKERLLSLDDAIRDAVGDMPFGGRRMNPNQVMDAWIIGRADPAYWQAMILKAFEQLSLPPGFEIPLMVLEFDREMQTRLERRGSGD